MAKPIHHDAGSALATAGWSAAKGAMLVGAIALGVGALAGVGIAAWIGGSTVSAGALVAGGAIGAAVTGGIGYVASTTSAVLLGLGALLGLAKGGSRISQENAAAMNRDHERSEARSHKRDVELNNAAIAGMQQGYMQGRNDTIAQIQQMAAMQQMGQDAKPVVGAQTAKLAQDRAAAEAKGAEKQV